jgi:hypothetical protein
MMTPTSWLSTHFLLPHFNSFDAHAALWNKIPPTPKAIIYAHNARGVVGGGRANTPPR